MMEPEAKEDIAPAACQRHSVLEVQGQQVRPNFSGTSKLSGTQQEAAAHSGEGVSCLSWSFQGLPSQTRPKICLLVHPRF